MESFSCGNTAFRGIKAPKKQGNSCKDRLQMSSLKKAFFPVIGAAILSLASLKEGFAQSTSSSSDLGKNAIAKNEGKPVRGFTSNTAAANDTTKATNTVSKNATTENPLDPAIRVGRFGDAQAHSGKNNLMVVQISGPALDKLKTEAQNIHDRFKKSVIPTEVVVFYNVNGKLSQILGSIAMNGEPFKLPSGTSDFDAETLKKYADTFAKYYYKNYGQATASNISASSTPAVTYEP